MYITLFNRSLGCTVFQLITGKIPFEDMDEHDIVFNARQNLHELLIPEQWSPNLKDFISLACKKVWKDRPKAEELKKHAFLIGKSVQTSITTSYQLEIWYFSILKIKITATKLLYCQLSAGGYYLKSTIRIIYFKTNRLTSYLTGNIDETSVLKAAEQNSDCKLNVVIAILKF